MFTQDKLKTKIHYCRDTGIFTWLYGTGLVKTGDRAGCLDLRAQPTPGRSGAIGSGSTEAKSANCWLVVELGMHPTDSFGFVRAA